MKRAATAGVATVVGLFWVLTFKVTPHPAGRPVAASPPPSPSAGQPVAAVPAPTASTAPTSTPSPTPVPTGHDGTFTGTDVSTIYGDVQVRIVVAGGRLSDVRALQLPSDRARSEEISQYAGPGSALRGHPGSERQRRHRFRRHLHERGVRRVPERCAATGLPGLERCATFGK